MKCFWFLTIVFASLILIDGAHAQNRLVADSPKFNLSTPYNTISTHLNFLQEGNYFPEVAGQAFNNKPPEGKTAAELAVKLKQVLDGNGIYVETADIPKNPNYQDSLTRKNRYYLTPKFPNLYIEKIGSDWVYSARTLMNIDKWHKQTYPFGTHKLLEILPKHGRTQFLGLYLWQLFGILILIVASFILHKLFTFIIEKFIIQLLKRLGYKKLADELVAPVAKPISFLVIFPLLILFVPVLQLPITTSRYIIVALKSIWPIFAIIFFYKLADVICAYLAKLADKTESTLDDQLVPMLRKIMKIFVVVVGGLFILDNLEFDITGLIAGISIGGLAFALAAQDTIKNFFGSLMIFVDRPFQVGDWITSGEVDGTVEEVGFRSTRIRSFRNSVMYIPNGLITNQTIDNHGLRVYRRFYTQLALTYDTPKELIEVFVDGLKEIVLRHPKTRKDYYEIHFNDMADSSLNIMFYIFFAVPSWTEELRARHEVLLDVLDLAEKLGVNFAFPTQTLHVETFPEKMANSPHYNSNSPELRNKLNEFLASKEAEDK